MAAKGFNDTSMDYLTYGGLEYINFFTVSSIFSAIFFTETRNSPFGSYIVESWWEDRKPGLITRTIRLEDTQQRPRLPEESCKTNCVTGVYTSNGVTYLYAPN